MRLLRRHSAGRVGHDVDRGHARHHPQELADIAQRTLADLHHLAWRCGHQVDHLAIVANADAAAACAVIAIKAAQQGGFSRAGRARQRHALAGRHMHVDGIEHRDAHAALQMQQEILRQVLNLEHHGHADSTELTSNCV
jgi:hypothetical protein